MENHLISDNKTINILNGLIFIFYLLTIFGQIFFFANYQDVSLLQKSSFLVI